MEDTANVSKMKKDAEKELSWQVEVISFSQGRDAWERTAAEDPESRRPGPGLSPGQRERWRGSEHQGQWWDLGAGWVWGEQEEGVEEDRANLVPGASGSVFSLAERRESGKACVEAGRVFTC